MHILHEKLRFYLQNFGNNTFALHMETPLEVTIDFDDASCHWRQNKRQGKFGQFQYVCEHVSARGAVCGRILSTSADEIGINFCRTHAGKIPSKK